MALLGSIPCWSLGQSVDGLRRHSVTNNPHFETLYADYNSHLALIPVIQPPGILIRQTSPLRSEMSSASWWNHALQIHLKISQS